MTLQLVAEKGSGAMYKILAADGQEYGPVNAETLQRWVTEGRVSAPTLVQAEGSLEWKPLSAFPELEHLLAGAPPPTRLLLEPGPASARPVAERAQEGLATASLVLGILSLLPWIAGIVVGVLPFSVGDISLLMCVTAIPAIITGAIAQSGARRDPARNRVRGLSRARAGLIAGCVGTVLWGLALLPLLPWPPRINEGRQRLVCERKLKQIGLALRLYAEDQNGVLPLGLASLSNDLGSPRVLICPADKAHRWAVSWGSGLHAKGAYQFLTPGAKLEEVFNRPIVRCPIHSNVCYGDGTVLREGVPKPQPPARSP